eukprot:scaffold33905_cov26-Tisochrysis_lutea.AAC.2
MPTCGTGARDIGAVCETDAICVAMPRSIGAASCVPTRADNGPIRTPCQKVDSAQDNGWPLENRCSREPLGDQTPGSRS